MGLLVFSLKRGFVSFDQPKTSLLKNRSVIRWQAISNYRGPHNFIKSPVVAGW
jgi:hypothetical protein